MTFKNITQKNKTLSNKGVPRAPATSKTEVFATFKFFESLKFLAFLDTFFHNGRLQN